METVFKKGDKVYCVLYGWGRVLEVDDVGNYPISVIFDCDEQIDYTLDGKLYDNSNPMLSFTEYTLQGFSQERQIELPEVGELCLFRDYDEDTWKVRKFDRYTSYSEFPFFDGSSRWKQMKRIKILD